MAFVWVSEFDCADCGESHATTDAEYDSLGYPVCPTCARTPSAANRRRGGNVAARSH